MIGVHALLMAAFLLTGMSAGAQDDPTVMTIAGHPVYRSELEYSYNRNHPQGAVDKKGLKDFVPLFINYKLKIQAALDARLDTLPSFRRLVKNFGTGEKTSSLSPNTDDEERETLRTYNSIRQRIDDNGGIVKVAQILIPLGQRASDMQQRTAKMLADSIYGALKNGASFADLARRFSEDNVSAANGGDLPWIAKGQMLSEFEDVAWNLQVGEISHPVLSPLGYHIILLKAERSFLPYDSVKSDLARFEEASHLRGQLIDHQLADTVIETGKTSDNLKESAETPADKDLQYQRQAYHDGLLLSEMRNRVIGNQTLNNEKNLAEYFKENKKKYRWSQPRFKGIVCYVKDEKEVGQVKRCLKKKPFEDWEQILEQTFNVGSDAQVRFEKGIFRRGENAVIDRKIFKDNVPVQTLKGYPYEVVYGKKMKKGPETYTDVRTLVIADYQDDLEKQWVETLHKKYPVTINEKVLAKIYQHHN
nr:peptidyl-prolyl cis-trans isomerase [uncultured Prevotella sp.]